MAGGVWLLNGIRLGHFVGIKNTISKEAMRMGIPTMTVDDAIVMETTGPLGTQSLNFERPNPENPTLDNPTNADFVLKMEEFMGWTTYIDGPHLLSIHPEDTTLYPARDLNVYIDSYSDGWDTSTSTRLLKYSFNVTRTKDWMA